MTENELNLENFKFFQNFDDDERKELAQFLEILSVKSGDYIFHQNEPGAALFVMRSGSVDLWVTDKTGDRISLNIVTEGEVFGEISLFDGGPRTANATAIDDSELFVLRRDRLIKFLEQKPHAAIDLLRIMGGRLRTTDELIAGRVSRNINTEVAGEFTLIQKVANFIADFSGSMPFLILNTAVFLIWILVNTGEIPGIEAFDPFPFSLLTTAVSLEAIFLSIFVLLAQNLQSAKEKVRNDIEYEINLKAELEVSHLHEKVDKLHGHLLARMHSIEESLAGKH